MITIKEIADIVGVSTTTVNNVIHGRTNQVSKATSEKIQKVLDEYNYVPNMTARNLAQNKSKIIGIALKVGKDKYENPIQDAYIGELIGSIEKNVRQRGYFLMIYISDSIEEVLTYVATWNVDGLVMLGPPDESSDGISKSINKPVVFVDSYYGKENQGDIHVRLEDRRGGYEMTKYLLESGHKKIAFVADNCAGVDRERFLGYRQALEEYNVNYLEEDFFRLTPAKGILESDLEKMYAYSMDYTALFCASDYYAVTIMNDLRDRGIKVPKDLSIVGFDNNIYSQLSRPALTTVAQDISKKGEIAVRELFKLIDNRKVGSEVTILPIEIIKRDTVSLL